jgi:hypothetical protein
MGVHSGRQLAAAEGLLQVVIGAQLQPHDPLHLTPPPGDHQHRDVAGSPHPPAHIEAIHVRERQVQQQQRVCLLAQQPQGCRALVADRDPVAAGFEVRPQRLPEHDIIFANQNAARHGQLLEAGWAGKPPSTTGIGSVTAMLSRLG